MKTEQLTLGKRYWFDEETGDSGVLVAFDRAENDIAFSEIKGTGYGLASDGRVHFSMFLPNGDQHDWQQVNDADTLITDLNK